MKRLLTVLALAAATFAAMASTAYGHGIRPELTKQECPTGHGYAENFPEGTSGVSVTYTATSAAGQVVTGTDNSAVAGPNNWFPFKVEPLVPGSGKWTVTGVFSWTADGGGEPVPFTVTADCGTSIPGPAGPTGPAGATGAQGQTGLTGAQGAPGATGAQGQTGPAGATGAKGNNGPAGMNGGRGPKGENGAKGAKGLTKTTKSTTVIYRNMPGKTKTIYVYKCVERDRVGKMHPIPCLPKKTPDTTGHGQPKSAG